MAKDYELKPVETSFLRRLNLLDTSFLVIGAVVTGLHEKKERPRKSALRRLWSRMNTMRRHRARAQHAATARSRRRTPAAEGPASAATGPSAHT